MREGIVSPATGPVTIEFLGMARHRAGRPELRASGRTVADLLRAVAAECPNLGGLLTTGGTLSRHYLISFDGESFVDNPDEMVPPGCRVLILGAEAGG